MIGNLTSKTIGGQTTKTRELVEWLREKHCIYESFDTCVKFGVVSIIKLVRMMRKSDYIITIMGDRGHMILLPLFSLFHKLYNTKIIEIVIGGTRWKKFKRSRLLFYLESGIELICAETESMVNDYQALGLTQTELLPNYKSFSEITEEEILDRGFRQIKIVYYGRIDRAKGADMTFDIIEKLVNHYRFIDFSLDFIGPFITYTNEDYEPIFIERMKQMPDNIRYLGTIDTKNAASVLKEYDVMLSPTNWRNEGFPGTFIEAMSAGLVILTTDMRNFEGIVKNGVNGWMIPRDDIGKYAETIIDLSKHIQKLRDMQIKSKQQSIQYKTENVLNKLNNIMLDKM